MKLLNVASKQVTLSEGYCIAIEILEMKDPIIAIPKQQGCCFEVEALHLKLSDLISILVEEYTANITGIFKIYKNVFKKCEYCS